jgi:hypothetical protein
MSRVKYEVVAPMAHRLFQKILLSKSEEELQQQYMNYHKFLESVGWTDAELDKAALELIDKDWEPPPPKILN